MKRVLEGFFTMTFFYWSFLLVHLSQDLNDKYSLEIFNNHYVWPDDESWIVAAIYGAYFLILFLLAKPIDDKIKNIIPNSKKRPLFHAILLTLVVLIVFAIKPSAFDLMVKLGFIWVVTLFQVLPSYFYEVNPERDSNKLK